MPWQQGGGGPWGGGGGGGGGGNSPWGRPSGGGPFGSGPTPPNIEDLIRRSQEKMKNIFPGGRRNSIGLAIIGVVLVVAWLFSGFFRVQPNEVGLRMIFGKFVGYAESGLNYNLPRPVGGVIIIPILTVNAIDIGFRAAGEARSGRAVTRPEEGQMLTGDENILDIQYTVLWRISDPLEYAFSITAPQLMVKQAAESAMREIVGNMTAQRALAEGRVEIENNMRTLLQRVLREYKAGIEITAVQLRGVDPPQQVIDAFRDVQRAQADRERLRNEAEAYRNQVVPEARGQAQKLIQEAEGFRQQVVAQAQGEAQRFTSVLNAYKLAPEVTKRRLYLEMMEDMLSRGNKVFIDQPAGGQSVVPFLPLQDLMRRGPAPAAAPAPTTAPGARP
jgi:membrane protease subunit HflK